MTSSHLRFSTDSHSEAEETCFLVFNTVYQLVHSLPWPPQSTLVISCGFSCLFLTFLKGSHESVAVLQGFGWFGPSSSS